MSRAIFVCVFALVAVGQVESFLSSGNIQLRGFDKTLKCSQLRRSVGIFQNLRSQVRFCFVLENAAEAILPQIISNPNEGWKADHQKAAEKSAAWAASGNVDTPDYFDEDNEVDILGIHVNIKKCRFELRLCDSKEAKLSAVDSFDNV